MLTRDLVERALPANLKSAVTQSLVDRLNTIATDPIAAENIRENFISYTKVLQEGKFKTEDYLNAVTYVSYQLMNHTNQEAYFKTFPDRYTALVAKGTSNKDISAYVSAYNKGKLVNLIREQTLTPSWVLNAHVYQEAINTQAELMRTAASEKVRSDAANSILTHLAKPKEAGPLINMNLQDASGMNELKDTLLKMAQMQQQYIAAGVPTKDITAQTIIDVEVKDVP